MHDNTSVVNSSAFTYRLEGELVDMETGFGIPDLRIDVVDNDGCCMDLVGTAKVDRFGHFGITLSSDYLASLFLGTTPTLAFRVYLYSAGVYQKFADPAETWTPSTPLTRIRLAFDRAADRTVTRPTPSIVRGRVLEANGRPVSGALVKAYDKGLPDNTLLGAYTTDDDGWYRIDYGERELDPTGKTHADLIVRAVDEDDDLIAVVGVLCHAPTTAIVNLIKNNVVYRGQSEEERVYEQIRLVIGETASIAALADEEISHIACSRQIERALVATYVKAAQIAATMALPPGAIYALLRQGLPQTRRGILAHRPAALRQAFMRSADENILSAEADTSDAIDQLVNRLVDYAVELAFEPREGGGTSLGDVIALVLAESDDRELFVREFINHEGTETEFWAALAANTGFTASSQIPRLKRVMQWGAVTRYHAPLVAELESRWTSNSWTTVRKIVEYDAAAWETILDAEVAGVAIGWPPDTPGSTEDEQRTNFAKILERSVETAFPTAVIAARIIQENDEPDLTAFFTHNPDFDFATTRVFTYLASPTAVMTGVTDVAATTQKLKKIERIFRLTRRYPEMRALLVAGLHSSQSIHRIGRSRFLSRFRSVLGPGNAERIFDRACSIATNAGALYTKYGAQLHNVPIFTLPDLVTPAENPQSSIADFTTLFGNADACSCEHCRSVYGPAAYLVDLLEFLERQDSLVETSASSAQNPQYFSARDVLVGYFGADSLQPVARRADIARILLSCANTNTTLPYIDLVNEILEVAVANLVDEPDHLWPAEIGTNQTASELLAEPEIIHPTARIVAYTALANAVHPFQLPFHVWESEARAYLEHLGVPRHALLETLLLPKKTTADITDQIVKQIAQERLRLSARAWDVLRGQPIVGVGPNDYWGVAPGATWWTGEGKIEEVPQFLKQSGLSFDELRELLATNYVDGVIELNPEAGCNIDAKSLTGLSEPLLGRIHRFLRLRKHLGLTITEVDWICTSFGVTDINDALLRNTADALALQKELNMPLSVLLSFWGPMGTRSYEGNVALYKQIFLTKAIAQLSNEFEAVGHGIDSDTTSILELAAGVMLGLRIKLDELAILMVNEVADAAMGLPSVLPANSLLTMENLSRLHRVVALARALRMPLREYIVLRELSGMNVLEGDFVGIHASPASTSAFITRVNRLRAAGLTVPEVHYIVRHVELPPASVGMASDTAARIVGELVTLVDAIVKDAAAAESASGQPVDLHERIDEAVVQKLATEMQLDVGTIGFLLRQGLHSVGNANVGALVDFYHDSLAPENDRKNHVVRLYKVAILVKRLKLDVAQLEWLHVEAGYNGAELDDLPVTREDDYDRYQKIFASVMRLVEFAAMRETLPDRGEALVSILRLAKMVINSQATVDDFYDEVALRMDLEFKGDDIKALSNDHFGYQMSDIVEENALGSVFRALRTLHDLGATVAQGIAWSNLDVPLPQVPDAGVDAADTSFEVKRAARTRYDDEKWPTIARPIRDGLREVQRNALVGYLISADEDVDQPNDLFAKLLIDVEMSPCQLTSRIKQAISSVQTFVQRSFLGMETDVKLSEDAAREWEWMKSYRVWEANRKVFLYPENWIEPELRDDKTPLFEALESGLNQGEIDAESAERVYVGYLNDLHGVGRLDVAAICREQEDNAECKGIDIVHVIARTHAQPHRYYYRKRIDGSYWTPWEKIDLDIQGDHLLATVWNRRLHLIWPTFEERTDNPQNPNGPVQTNWRVSLAWSTYEADGFGPMLTSKTFFYMMPSIPTKWISFLVARGNNDLLVSCFVNWYGILTNLPPATRWSMIAGVFAFQPCLGDWKVLYNARPISVPPYQQNVIVWTPITATTEFMRVAEVTVPSLPIGPDINPPPPNNALRFPKINGAPFDILDKTPGRYALLMDRTVENVTYVDGPRDAFFYIDATRTFFVEKRAQLAIKWTDPNTAYPNMPANIGWTAAQGLEPAVIQWANHPVLDMNVDYSIDELYRFHTFYHPYVCEFIRRLARDGVDGLLRWSSGQETALQQLEKTDVHADYDPTGYVYQPFPIENVDFSFGGTYSQYNWELFFHAPFMIATRLTRNGRFEDADRWYRYIFDPTGGAPGDGPERFWNVRPFRENLSLASIQELLATLSTSNPQAQELEALFGLEFDSDGGTTIAAQLARWRENPFNPHLIARMRIVAFQKAVVMKYVDNLLAWGDSLFRRDTMESINEATQLYILASQILGPRPRLIKTNDVAPKTYAQLETEPSDVASPLEELEVIVPEPRNRNACCSNRQPAPTWHMPYFCVPHNEKMLALWDTVEDRLLKVRCCMNIDGVVRQLPLFEAPLDPGLLVRATAAGLDLGEVLADVFVPLPNYRFSILLPKAVEFAGGVAAMGNALLSALEKRDGEALSKLRSTQEIDMLTRVREIRIRQVDEARETLEGLRRSREVIDERRRFYTEIPNRITEELMQKKLSNEAMVLTGVAQGTQLAASVLKLIPQLALGVASFSEFGGTQLAGILEVTGLAFGLEASHRGTQAAMAGTEAGYARRAADWNLQKTLAERELAQMDRQIAAAEIRLDIAQKELQNHDQSLKNAKAVDDYLRTKYTREELYEWLITQVKGIYFQAYKVAYDLAKRAQKSFQFELALPDKTYLQPAYWDKTTDGLLAGERLQHDLRRMDAAYLELNNREFELTKHVSLAEVAPLALLKLREHDTEHWCDVDLQEWMFDQDWPGHYLRRIKSVSMSIPVVSGTYAGVNCKLTLTSSTVRMTDSLNGGYARDSVNPSNDTRFADNRVLAQSIVTSSAQQDGGLFELVFRDERYLPFEGAGVESSWRISLDPKTNRFRLSDAKDVILHIRYVARESGVAAFQTAAEGALELNNGPVGYRLFSAKADFPGEWAVFTTITQGATSQTLALPLARKHFQSLRGEADHQITAVQVFAKRPGTATNTIPVTLCAPGVEPQGPDAKALGLAYENGAFGRLFHNLTAETFAEEIQEDGAEAWKLVVPAGELPLDDIWIVCTYKKA